MSVSVSVSVSVSGSVCVSVSVSVSATSLCHKTINIPLFLPMQNQIEEDQEDGLSPNLHQCESCDRSFLTARGLNIHSAVHMTEEVAPTSFQPYLTQIWCTNNPISTYISFGVEPNRSSVTTASYYVEVVIGSFPLPMDYTYMFPRCI